MPVPELSDHVIHDHETEAVASLTSLTAYRMAIRAGWGIEYAESWAAWTKAHRKAARDLDFLAFLRERGLD